MAYEHPLTGRAREQALRSVMRSLQDAAEFLGASGRFLDLTGDPIGIREDISTAYAAVSVLGLRVRGHLNVAEEPPHTRED